MRLAPVILALCLAACRPAPPIDNGPVETPVANEAKPPPALANEAQPVATDPAPIPAKFHGTWANTPNACKNFSHYSRLVISGRSLRFADFVLVGDQFSIPEPDEFAVEGKIEGKNEVAAAHFSTNKHGDLLRDEAGGGSVRMRCA